METPANLSLTWRLIAASWIVFIASELAMAACWFEIAWLQRYQPNNLTAVPGILVCSLLPAILSFFQFRATYQQDRAAASAITAVLATVAVGGSIVMCLLPVAVLGVTNSLPMPTFFLATYGMFFLLLLVAVENWKWSSRLQQEAASTLPPPFQWSLFTIFGLMTLFALQFAIASIGLRLVAR